MHFFTFFPRTQSGGVARVSPLSSLSPIFFSSVFFSSLSCLLSPVFFYSEAYPTASPSSPAPATPRRSSRSPRRSSPSPASAVAAEDQRVSPAVPGLPLGHRPVGADDVDVVAARDLGQPLGEPIALGQIDPGDAVEQVVDAVLLERRRLEVDVVADQQAEPAVGRVDELMPAVALAWPSRVRPRATD